MGQLRSGLKDFFLEGVLGATAASRVILGRPYHIISNHHRKSIIVCQASCDSPGQFRSMTYEAHFRLYTTTRPEKKKIKGIERWPQDASGRVDVYEYWLPLVTTSPEVTLP